MSFLGIDIGSSAIKGMVVNENGQIIEFSRIQTEHFSPQPGWFELDPENIFKAVLNLIDSISLKVKKYDPIRSISFSCLGTAFFPVDKKGKPLYRAISSLDKRSLKYLGWLENKGIDSFDIYKISGQPRNIVSFLHNLIWFKKYFGGDFKNIYKFLSPKDYIISRLGLGQHTDFTQASRTMLYDFKAKKWSGYICNAIDLDFDLLKETKEDFVFDRIERIIREYGTVKEKQKKLNTLFFLLSYGERDQNIKVEINRRNFGSRYEVKSYLGVSMLVMVREDMFANKLVAMLERKKIANRDVFDVWHFLKNRWPINKEIVERRTKSSFKDYLKQCIKFVKDLSDRAILAGIGELIDAKQKAWIKAHLKKDTAFLLKVRLEQEN